MENQRVVREASKVLVIGSGALGIRKSGQPGTKCKADDSLTEFATDIKSYYPSHEVTLINSRPRFMSIYHEDMHKYIQEAMDDLGITVYHNERLEDMDALERLRDEAVQAESKDASGRVKKGRKMIRLRLKSGREVESDLQVGSEVTQVPFADACVDPLYRATPQPRAHFQPRAESTERQGVIRSETNAATRSSRLRPYFCYWRCRTYDGHQGRTCRLLAGGCCGGEYRQVVGG